MRKLSILLILALVVGVAFVASAQGPTRQEELSAAGFTSPPAKPAGPAFSKLKNAIQLPANNKAPETGTTETTQYDSGAITALPVGFGTIFGNQFNADNAGNPYKGTVTLNSFSFYFAEDDTADTGLIFQAAAPLNATSITARVSVAVTGLVNAGSSFSMLTTINVAPQTALGTASTGVFPGEFYLGAWCLNANTSAPVDNEALGLDTATFNGGHQGYTASSGTGAQPFNAQSFNAVLRANITGVVPVELMAFDVE